MEHNAPTHTEVELGLEHLIWELTQRHDAQSRREKIFALQKALEGVEQLDLPPHHAFAPGAYARSLLLPKDSVVVGKIHKHAHINVISFGYVLVMTEGEGLQELRGPLIFTSSPGTKRAVWPIEDTLWTTCHVLPFDTTDLEEIERHVIAKSYEDYEHFRLESERCKSDGSQLRDMKVATKSLTSDT